MGFIGRAFIIESEQMVPNFKVALSVESGDQKYSCSLDVFLGDVKVWTSGHFSRFYTTEKCVLELTQSGDLQLKGQEDRLGWKAGTSGQGVEVNLNDPRGNVVDFLLLVYIKMDIGFHFFFLSMFRFLMENQNKETCLV